MPVYSYTLLHNRLMGPCERMVAESEQAPRPGHDIGTFAFAAIVLADAAIEIAIHHKIETSLPRPEQTPSELVEVIRIARQAILKRLPPLNRLRELGRILNVQGSWETGPWSLVSDLHEVRNALAHYEAGPVISDHPEAITFPRRAQLEPIAKRLGTMARYHTNGVWLEVFLNPVCARWAYTTADKALRELDSKMWQMALHF